MVVQPGISLGFYEVLSALGKGGMGEVWRARDSKLGREVALKTLPEEFARDNDRLARFEREARVLAAINHPNIASIYGLEEHAGGRFIVLELVEGENLAERLARGPMPVEDAIRVRSPDRNGRRSRAREGRRPSRSEASEHQNHTGRNREGSGFWPREGT